MLNVNEILQTADLPKLLQPDFFIGWTYAIDYEFAHVMTNDLWKYRALGIPHNCFLVAASFNPAEMAKVPPEEQEVILLRVVGSAKLPQDDDMVRTKIDHFKDQKALFGTQDRQMDDITLNELQFGGLKCRVLGTFFEDDNELWLGSDLESFATATRLNVYRPHDRALERIVNYVDPIRRRGARETAEQLGLKGEIKPFQVGTVRYTSTDRLHRRHAQAVTVPVFVQPADFLARRTAVLGMTRTGKSNMVKQMVSVVKRVADESGAKIGQIIYDINGEYANANQQDKGALADIYPQDTVRYRMLEAAGFRELRTNFYEQLNEGFGIIQRELEEAKRVTTDYVRAFVNLSFDEPDAQEQGELKRWRVRVAAYQTLLYAGGFEAPAPLRVKFDANQTIQTAVNRLTNAPLPDPKFGLTLEQAKQWFLAAREADMATKLKSSSGKDWVDDSLQTLLNMLAQRQGNTYISGHRILADATKYHSPNRTTEVADEIYDLLKTGKIVILDLSVGDARIREKVSTRIAQKIFQNSMQVFVDGNTPPNVVVYIEEAHNLIGKGMNLTETWPRLAKEGAKYRISLVYATQEVSSMHPNILANTENWFITHLNNAREIKELAQFYDFEDFSDSLIRAQDIGFARVKTLSSPFVIPVQIDKFDPDAERQRVAAVAGRR
jgi:hypothetical protein